MGVSGCGKTTVARATAHALGFEYHDADDYHPDTNKAPPLDIDDIILYYMLCLSIYSL